MWEWDGVLDIHVCWGGVTVFCVFFWAVREGCRSRWL